MTKSYDIEEARVLDIKTASSLAAILHSTRGAIVARKMADGSIVTGTSLNITRDGNNTLVNASDDVRDCFLRVAASGGYYAFWRVDELLAEVPVGIFITNYQEASC